MTQQENIPGRHISQLFRLERLPGGVGDQDQAGDGDCDGEAGGVWETQPHRHHQESLSSLSSS